MIIIFSFSLTFFYNLDNCLYANEAVRIDPTVSGQMQPYIFGDKVVWEDIRDGISQIYIHDLTTGSSSSIDPTTNNQSWASIYESKVVWEDRRDNVNQIYFYDLAEPTISSIRIDPSTNNQSYPVIFQDSIAWSDSRDGQEQIYLYSILTSSVTRVDPTTSSQIHPDIYQNRIVWTDSRDGKWQVYLYDISSGISTRLSPSSHDQYKPSISGDKVVWQEQSEIKVHDLMTSTNSILSPSSSNRMQPDINGNYVVWLDDIDGEWQVYLYNIEKGFSPFRVSSSAELQDYPNIYGNKIVWSDWRDLGLDPQTYLYTIPLEKTETVVLPDFIEKIKGFFLTIFGIVSQAIESLISSSSIPGKSQTEGSVEDKEFKEETEEIIEEQPVKDKQDNIGEEAVRDETQEDIAEEVEGKEAQEQETSGQEEKIESPTIKLKVYEGPIYSSVDNVCYYRIKADVTGKSIPDVKFSRDDSNGAWGPYIAQVNLQSVNDSYKLSASATNSEGTATDTIDLYWECEIKEGFEISDINKDDIKKIIEGVDTGQTTHPYMVLHPSDIGYVVYPSGVNTTTCFIGDSISNTDVKGYFAFDTSPLTGKDVVSATLYMDGTVIEDPTFKGTISLRWGTYLPLTADDYLMLGLVRPVDTFDNNENPIVFSREDLVVAIENDANVFHDKLQFGIAYYHDTTDGDNLLDGRKYRTEDISLIVYYED